MDLNAGDPDSGKNTATEASIVVPTFQEADNIRPLVMRIAGAMVSARKAYEINIVGDNSRDGSEQIVEELQSASYPVRIITRTNERGLSSAVVRGFQEANGDVLVCMDADLSHPLEALPGLLQGLCETGSAFAIGSRSK